MYIKIILKSGIRFTREMNQILEFNKEYIKIINYDGEVEQISTNKIRDIEINNNIDNPF